MKKEDLELAWAAGLWDGEGCSHKSKPKHRYMTKNGLVEKGYVHRSMSMCQYHSPDVLIRFIEAVGIGNVGGPYTNKKTGKQYWQLHIGNKKAVEVLIKLWPYLSEPKKEQARNVFPELESK